MQFACVEEGILVYVVDLLRVPQRRSHAHKALRLIVVHCLAQSPFAFEATAGNERGLVERLLLFLLVECFFEALELAELRDSVFV